MKRAGFTMIELIFVIVILGILAAVALPKFIGVSDQANAGKCAAFYGTMNRTVGPSMWSEAITNGYSVVLGATNTELIVNNHIAIADIPVACLNQTGVTLTEATARGFLDDNITGITFGTSTYDANFTDGNLSSSPVWTWTKTN